MTGLTARLTLSRGTFTLDVDLSVPAGTVLAVLGPNGAGKSTLLDGLVGLHRPDRGAVVLGGRDVTAVPVHSRRIALLAQDAMLFPHLSVLDNVAFAPRSAGLGRATARDRARHWLSEVDAGALADRGPAQLSGGQAQRVAVARALAGEPELLLLDEPLAALDVDAARAVRGLLRRVIRAEDRCTVLVTHDPLDALTLADHVVVLDAGRVVERGPVRDVLAAPRTAFTARIAGLNLVPGTVTGAGLRTGDGQVIAGVAAADAVAGQAGVAVFPPSAVAVFPAGDPPGGSPRNTVAATVATLEPHGPVIRLRTAGSGWAADLTPAAVAELGLEPGVPVRLAVKAAAVTVHPALD
ncbi:sulfate/molybdate ABC transporter ATP-binding protein [Amycolatopsis suaedae]|uniref:ABC transporter ATP-binding protein n=1 Tax=Amycolatopsis suaedae TaxID=2510978 RepID=A0A4V2ELJ8_9PSEU|nr:ABC transporter ATP-binding protein [Amycolatopsis suaedae]RZQ61815.1 ABC transporter ATP-binding protein [Amycolatopsis suaedae]